MQATSPLHRGATLAPLLILFVAATPAAAQSTVGQWDGAYFGGSLALAGLGADRVAVSPPGDQPGTLIISGALAAVQVGWMGHRGNLVWGIEGDVQLGHVADAFSAAPYDASSTVSQAASLRLLAGMPAGRKGLLYLSGGITAAKIEYSVTGPGGLNLADDSFHTGYEIGAGYEHALSANWSARLEYKYANFGKTNLNDGIGETEETPDYHMLRIGINRRF